MTRGRLSLVILLPAALLAYVLVAQAISFGGEEAAVTKAEDYLKAACDEAGDRGWSMLVGDQRTAEFGGRARYLARAADSDCDRFSWEIGSTSCDDGVCVVWLSVPDREAIPGFLAEAGIVSFRVEKVPPGTNAGMAILQRAIFGPTVIVPDL